MHLTYITQISKSTYLQEMHNEAAKREFEIEVSRSSFHQSRHSANEKFEFCSQLFFNLRFVQH